MIKGGFKDIYELKEEYFQICQDLRNWDRMYEIVKNMERMEKVPGSETDAFNLCKSHIESVAQS